jgi:thiamine biosynthesis lipoprotein
MQNEFEFKGKAMGTDYSISIVCDSEVVAQTHAHTAIEQIKAYELRFSRFLPDSELSVLNREKNAIVSDTFLRVTEEAYKLFSATRGVFNPLVQIDRLGYTSDFDSLEESPFVAMEDEYSIDFTLTTIDPATHRITLLPGQKLDFGGFLKGYLATLLAREIKDKSPQISGVIVNIGGDIHTEGLDEDGNIFEFTIFNPLTGQDDIMVPLKNCSLATSGIYKRTWKHNGQSVHHILDPSGIRNPDTECVSASVIHKDGGTAEAYTKVYLSLGIHTAEALLSAEDTIYILITNTGEVITNRL